LQILQSISKLGHLVSFLNARLPHQRCVFADFLQLRTVKISIVFYLFLFLFFFFILKKSVLYLARIVHNALKPLQHVLFSTDEFVRFIVDFKFAFARLKDNYFF